MLLVDTRLMKEKARFFERDAKDDSQMTFDAGCNEGIMCTGVRD